MNAVAVNTRTLFGPLTGIQRYTGEMVRRLGQRVDCLCPDRKPRGLQNLWWDQVSLPRRLAGRLLWSPDSTGPLSVRRQVVTVHDVIPLDRPDWFTWRLVLFWRTVVPPLLRRVRRIVTDSEYTRRRVLALARVDPGRIAVVHPGVDERFSPPRPGEIERACTVLGLPSRHYVLSLCTLEPRKNLRGLLRVWGDVGGELPGDLWLVIAGEKGDPRLFRDTFPEAIPPRTHWTGRVDDALLPALYGGAAALVYPSLYEGFGLPPLEAMACGTPVVTSATTSLPEVVGEAAITVDPTDANALAGAMRRVLTDSRVRDALRREGIERARRFSWETAAERLWSLLEAEARIPGAGRA